ncbi:uncharacterized protein LOC115034507 [Acyrthosiphon pisum]|uniref:Uncharacterized protein n=1 Tax=Acyrthosiphon pisum TaxID=7029 RepID=A0A8R2JW41_ACYPI|nr:uncharacterized protein LOC115034507 [Acyrthosiphon pisum]
MSKAHDILSNSNKENYQLISQQWQSNVTGSQQSEIINELNLGKNDEFVVDDIIDRLTGIEFFRLLNIEPKKRLEAIIYNYRVFNKTLEDDESFEKLDKLSNDNIQTEVPYEIYIEAVDDESLKLKVGNIRIWSIQGVTNLFQEVNRGVFNGGGLEA